MVIWGSQVIVFGKGIINAILEGCDFFTCIVSLSVCELWALPVGSANWKFVISWFVNLWFKFLYIILCAFSFKTARSPPRNRNCGQEGVLKGFQR